jgi:uroporphyrinogen-III synthase
MKAHEFPFPRRPRMRALITRPRAEAEALAAELARHGIASVVEPLMEIAGRAAPAPDLAGIQAVLCTSANGVRALAQACGERAVPLLAVGDATAARARAEGFRHVESAGGDVEDLAYLVRRRLRPEGGRLLHVAGSEVAGDLAKSLGDQGFAVERLVLYEGRPVAALTPETARLIARGEIDFALFFSPRTAAIFARLLDEAEAAAGLAATTAASISAASDAMLADLPFRARLIAAAPTQAALVELVARHIGQPA